MIVHFLLSLSHTGIGTSPSLGIHIDVAGGIKKNLITPLHKTHKAKVILPLLNMKSSQISSQSSYQLVLVLSLMLLLKTCLPAGDSETLSSRATLFL